MKVDWNKEANIITVGKAEFKGYKNFKNAMSFAFYVMEQNDVSLTDLRAYTLTMEDRFGMQEQALKPKMDYKARNNKIGDILGCSAARLWKYFDKLQKKAFIAPVYDIYKKVKPYRTLKGKFKWDETELYRVNQNKQILEEVYNDGLFHLLPVVNKMSKSPSELKKEFGNAWKVVSKNSLNKNKALADALRKYCLDSYKEVISIDLPTTLLQGSQWKPEIMKWLKDHHKGKWGNKDFIQGQARLYQDTVYMAEQLDKTVNPSWSPRRMKEEHDQMAHEINARKYSKDLFDSTKEIVVKCLELEEYKATLLESAFDIAEEGTQMGHCVAGYAESVKSGDYLVYSVTKNGERSSTIGINKVRTTSYHNKLTGVTNEQKGGWRMQQHYGKYNQRVEDLAENELATKLIHKLNGASK